MSTGKAMSAQSYLFVPATRPDRFDNALSSGADAVIIDLEDSVGPSQKVQARHNLIEWVSASKRILVRINGRATEWYGDDAKIARLDGIAGIVLPKAESVADVEDIVEKTDAAVPVYPLIETAQGMLSAIEIAKAPCVERLMFGTLDFIAELGLSDMREGLNIWRAHLALVSCATRLDAPVDGVTPEINDVDLLQADVTNGKRLGFGGKLCIHPKQVPIVNASYRPGEHEIEWARKIVRTMNQVGGGAISVDGEMIDRPVLLRAQRILALIDRSSL